METYSAEITSNILQSFFTTAVQIFYYQTYILYIKYTILLCLRKQKAATTFLRLLPTIKL